MKKLLLCIAIMMTLTSSLFSQDKKIKYQGEAFLGATVLMAPEAVIGSVSMNLITGARFGKYFAMGIGTGLNDYVYKINNQLIWFPALPVYLNVKGYLPVGKKNNLFISIDGGYLFHLTDIDGVTGGYTFSPAIGMGFGVGKKDKQINCSIGYILQSLRLTGTLENNSGVAFKVAFQF